MRVIGGTLKGRRFNPPAKNWPTRPTTDFAKEGLFNILHNRIDFEDLKVLDLYGGTGSHCYEFISRGCSDATYVDQFIGCVKFVTKTAKEFGIDDRLRIVKSDVFKYISRNKLQYDYIFAGPPYPLPNLDEIPGKIFKYQTLAKDGLFVLEHNPNHNFEQDPHFIESRNYGTTIFSFFSC